MNGDTSYPVRGVHEDTHQLTAGRMNTLHLSQDTRSLLLPCSSSPDTNCAVPSWQSATTLSSAITSSFLGVREREGEGVRGRSTLADGPLARCLALMLLLCPPSLLLVVPPAVAAASSARVAGRSRRSTLRGRDGSCSEGRKRGQACKNHAQRNERMMGGFCGRLK